MVRVGQNHFRAVGRRRIGAVVVSAGASGLGEIQSAGLSNNVGVRAPLLLVARVGKSHAHRVLLRLALLLRFDEPDQMVLPLDRVDAALVDDLVQHVVQVVYGVHQMANVGFLQTSNCW